MAHANDYPRQGDFIARRSLPALGLALLLLAGALSGCTNSSAASTSGDTARRPVPVRVQRLLAEEVVEVASATGIVAAQDEVSVTFPVAGRVAEVLVREGENVRAGDVLARLTDEQHKAQVDAAQAVLVQAQQGMAVAERQAGLARARAEVHIDAAGAPEPDVARALADALAGVQSASAAVSAARARVRQSNEQLADISLRAPIAGTVLVVETAVGEQAGLGRPAVVLGSARQVAELTVSAEVATRLVAGAHTSLLVSGRSYASQVTRVGSQAQAGAVEVEVEIPEHYQMLPGSPVAAEFELARRHARTLPLEALDWTGRGFSVWVLAGDDYAERRPVGVQALASGRWEITGVADGDHVVVSGLAFLHGDRCPVEVEE